MEKETERRIIRGKREREREREKSRKEPIRENEIEKDRENSRHKTGEKTERESMADEEERWRRETKKIIRDCDIKNT